MTRTITVEALKMRIDAEEEVLILDVRDADAFAAGHVPGARHVPLDRLRAELPGLPLHRPVVTVCHKGGGRSEAAADLLVDAGAAVVFALTGGTLAWLHAYPQGVT